MVRVVLDTNIVISGSLWSGTPSRVMKALNEKRFQAIASETTIQELSDVLKRPKFSKRLNSIGLSAEQIANNYAEKVEIVNPVQLSTPISSDPDDDIFIACAIAGRAIYIVSGDPHLLDVKKHNDILIITAQEFLDKLS